MFYQYFTLDKPERDITFFTKVVWGHSTSTDLLNWNVHEKIINGSTDPLPTFFRGKEVKTVSNIVPFSGSAIVDTQNVTGLLKSMDDPVIVVYTSLSKMLFGEIDEETNNNFIFSTVYMYYSYDGYKFQQYETPMIDKSLTIRNFRDPIVFKYEDNHYNLIMCENLKLAIHKSKDLIHWEKVSLFDYPLPNDVVELETPNLLTVDKTSLMIVSINVKADDSISFFCTMKYFVGTFDGYEFKVEKNQSREFDGPDLYAISINDGIMMGMINNWKYIFDTPFFNGTLTYPRKVSKYTDANTTLTYLTQEFFNLDVFSEEQVNKKGIVDNTISYNFRNNKAQLIRLKLDNMNCKEDCDFNLKFEDANSTFIVGYTHSTNEFYIDRTNARQVNKFFNNVHDYKQKYKKILDDNHFEIDILLDVNTIEFLADKGIVGITALHLNDKIFKTVTLTTNKNYKVDYKIRSSSK